MRRVYIVRHAHWDLIEDTVSAVGQAQCFTLKPSLPAFDASFSSRLGRARETAAILSGVNPEMDTRLGFPKSPTAQSREIARRRQTHPLGVAGAIFSIPEVRERFRIQAQALLVCIREVMAKLPADGAALMVSHDGLMVALEKLLRHEPFDEATHTFGELEGFIVTEKLELEPLEPHS